MAKRYYKYDSLGMGVPSPGVPMHTKNVNEKKRDAFDEIVEPRPILTPLKEKAKEEKFLSSLLKNGKLLGRYEADDIMILCIIFLLLQDKEQPDIPLLLALGYIFLSDKEFFLN